MRYLSFFILAVIPVLFMSFSSGGQSQNNVQIQDEPTMCTMQYDPVCGVDGVTYGNACSAGKTEIAYAGECALPDLQYCAAYYDGCNNCSVEEWQVAACTLMYCESPTTPRCTQFVETVKRNDMVLIDKQKQTELSTIFNTITTPRNSLDTETQHKYYKALARAFDARVKEWKDFAMVASFTPEGYAQFQKKIIIYAYLHHITQEKIANIK
jgi:hypothetical protein